MPEDIHIKRFFIEIYNNEDMYNDYLKGILYLDNDLFKQWINNFNFRNYVFVRTLQDFNRIGWNDTILESTTNEKYCVSKNFHNNSIISISEFGKFKIKKSTIGEEKKHYICNGYYQDTLEQIYKVLDKGAFTVGVSSYKNKELFDDIVNYYNKLKMYLLKNNYRTAAIQTYVAGSKVYLLMYDSEKQSRWKNDCSNNRTNWGR